jgi:UDP-glucose/GDP-mannose dehydrogenase family, UDP binding domain
MREAPSLVIVPMLQAKGARVRACDPHGRANAERLLPGVEWCDNAFETAEKPDLLVLLTEWNEFRALDLKQARLVMRGDALLDLRNVYPQALVEAAGLVSHGVGRPAIARQAVELPAAQLMMQRLRKPRTMDTGGGLITFGLFTTPRACRLAAAKKH